MFNLRTHVTHETETASAFTRLGNGMDLFEEYASINPCSTSDFVTPINSLNPVSQFDISLGKLENDFLNCNDDKVKDESTVVNNCSHGEFIFSQKSINYLRANSGDCGNDLRPMHSFSLSDYQLLEESVLEEKPQVAKASNQAGLSGKNDNPIRSKLPGIKKKQDVKKKKRGRGRPKKTAGATASINLNCQRKKVHLPGKVKKKSGTSAVYNGSATISLKTSPLAAQCEKKKAGIVSNVGTKRRGRPIGSKNRKKVKRANAVKRSAAALLSLTVSSPKCQSNGVPIAKASKKDGVKRIQPATPKTSKRTKTKLKFNKKIFTSYQAAKQFKCSKIPLKHLLKSAASGANKCYTVSDVNCFIVQYGKMQKKNEFMKFSTTDEVKYDNSKTIDENMKDLQGAIYGGKKIEVLKVEEKARWSEALCSICLQAFVKFRAWPNRYNLIAKFMGNTKTLKQIRDHVGKIRRRIMKTDKEHPYVKYYKTNKPNRSLEIKSISI